MTQQDNWRPEMARLTQRQDQLERQQMDSTGRVEAMRRDADAFKRDVDRRLDSLRGETDRQIRDGDRRVSSLERSRDTLENLFWSFDPPGHRRRGDHHPGHRGGRIPGAAPGTRGARAAFAVIYRRSPGRFRRPPATGSGCCRDTFPTTSPLRSHQRRPGDHAGGPGNYFPFTPSTSEERPPVESQSYRVGRVFSVCFLTGPTDPAWSSRYLPPGSRLHTGRSQGAATRGLAQIRNPTRPRETFFQGRPPVFRSINQLGTVGIGVLWT